MDLSGLTPLPLILRPLFRPNNHLCACLCSVSRPYNFVTRNGPSPVFDGYAQSLDSLMVFTWNQLESIKVCTVVLMVRTSPIITRPQSPPQINKPLLAFPYLLSSHFLVPRSFNLASSFAFDLRSR